MSTDTAGPLLLVAVLVAYTLVYRFISTGLVDSLILTINLGTLTLLVPMLVNAGRVGLGMVMGLLLLVFASPIITQLWFQQRVRSNQKTQIQRVLFHRAQGASDLNYELAEAFANLAELLIDPDIDPFLHYGFTWRARHRQRLTFLAALTASQQFAPIAEEELEITDGLFWGRWFRGLVGIPSVLLFFAACFVFLVH
jgi:hypothetical protein